MTGERQKTLDRKLKTLMKDYGYRVEGKLLISTGVPGWTSDSIIRRCNGMLDAVERLIPIVHNDEFSERYRRICES